MRQRPWTQTPPPWSAWCVVVQGAWVGGRRTRGPRAWGDVLYVSEGRLRQCLPGSMQQPRHVQATAAVDLGSGGGGGRRHRRAVAGHVWQPLTNMPTNPSTGLHARLCHHPTRLLCTSSAVKSWQEHRTGPRANNRAVCDRCHLTSTGRERKATMGKSRGGKYPPKSRGKGKGDEEEEEDSAPVSESRPGEPGKACSLLLCGSSTAGRKALHATCPRGAPSRSWRCVPGYLTELCCRAVLGLHWRAVGVGLQGPQAHPRCACACVALVGACSHLLLPTPGFSALPPLPADNQRSNVGLLPPSDSEEEEEEQGSAAPAGADAAKPAAAAAPAAVEASSSKPIPSKKADDDDSSDDDDDDSDDDSDSDDAGGGGGRMRRVAAPQPRRR